MPFAGRISFIVCCWGCFLSDMGKIAALLLITCAAHAEIARLKDLVSLEGERDNQLLGYGLVVGLARTGDSQTTLFLDAIAVESSEAHGRDGGPHADAGA